MGVESGGRGDASPGSKKIRVGRPPEIMICLYLFLDTYYNFAFSNILKIKWPKSEEKLNFGG